MNKVSAVSALELTPVARLTPYSPSPSHRHRLRPRLRYPVSGLRSRPLSPSSSFACIVVCHLPRDSPCWSFAQIFLRSRRLSPSSSLTLVVSHPRRLSSSSSLTLILPRYCYSPPPSSFCFVVLHHHHLPPLSSFAIVVSYPRRFLSTLVFTGVISYCHRLLSLSSLTIIVFHFRRLHPYSHPLPSFLVIIHVFIFTSGHRPLSSSALVFYRCRPLYPCPHYPCRLWSWATLAIVV